MARLEDRYSGRAMPVTPLPSSWPAEPAQLDELAAQLLGLAEEPVWRLAVPAQVAEQAVRAGRLVIVDPEGAQAGVLHLDRPEHPQPPPPAADAPALPDAADKMVELTGRVEPAGDSAYGIGRPLWRSPGQLAEELGRAALVAVTDRPLLRADLDALHEAAAGRPGAVLIVVTAAHRGTRVVAPGATLAAVTTSARSLGAATRVVPAPVPGGSAATRTLVADRYGEALHASEGRLVDTAVADALVDELGARLDRGDPVGELVDPAAAAILRRARPPLHRRGVVVLLSGLSGSGKSTIARLVRSRILASTERTVTLLDGDVVRRLLSAGLGFSRADRELNLARIGFVAAEAARHGGIALCAPIAPYASSRARMRQLALDAGADFLLVWVATPLAECERRDRKGLYARARTGEIDSFTGISDPFEPPTDADLVLDTTDLTPEQAAEAVLGLLRARGYLMHAGAGAASTEV
jgi:sulfate adenylyltransferase